MPTVGSSSLFNIQIHGSIHGESTMNSFWYFCAVSPETIEVLDLIPAFVTKVSADWEASVSDEWDGERVIADELTSDSNFYDGPTGLGPGTLTGDTLGPNVAYSYRLHRRTKETRSGWKRIAGVVEASQGDGVIGATQQTANDALAAEFLGTLTVDANTIYPVIVRKTYSGEPPVLNAPSQWIYNYVNAVTANSNLTTQNTRKYSG